MRPVWTTDQIEYLKTHYENTKTTEMLSVLTDKTNDQLRWKAKEFGLRKRVTRSKCDITFLENLDDPEACYWWGFITADGCINNCSLIVAIHERDEAHLLKFCAKAGGAKVSRSTKINDWHPVPYTMVRTALSDQYTLERLKERFKIQPRKTYHPFDIAEFCTPTRLCHYLAGIIDGDGHIYIRPQGGIVCIAIKVHPNWTETFRLLSTKLKELYDIDSTVTHGKEGWVVLRLQKMRHVVALYDRVKNRVPLMSRKWDGMERVKDHCARSIDRRLKPGPSEVRIDPQSDVVEGLIPQ